MTFMFLFPTIAPTAKNPVSSLHVGSLALSMSSNWFGTSCSFQPLVSQQSCSVIIVLFDRKHVAQSPARCSASLPCWRKLPCLLTFHPCCPVLAVGTLDVSLVPDTSLEIYRVPVGSTDIPALCCWFRLVHICPSWLSTGLTIGSRRYFLQANSL